MTTTPSEATNDAAAAADVVMDVATMVQERTKSAPYMSVITKAYEHKLQVTGDRVAKAFGSQNVARGKVRDRIDNFLSPSTTETTTTASPDTDSTTNRTSRNTNTKVIALVTTDRQSGFDRQLALVPYKGAVLNLTSAYWFEQTKHIIGNHVLAVPHPYVTIAKQCTPFPIEFVVRSYLTGSTSTSIWKNYAPPHNVRNYCGHRLPDGMVKNQKLAQNLLTPTTKEADHDRPISCAAIVEEDWMTQQDLDVCSTAAMRIFALGQQLAAQQGLILVDTKYEFGRCHVTGDILLIDEVHTPDSSRYWLAATYAQNIARGKEPDNIDKEFLRLWFRDQPQCDPYDLTRPLPVPPADFVTELSRRYITLYEMITGNTKFQFTTKDDEHDDDSNTVLNEEQIVRAIQNYKPN